MQGELTGLMILGLWWISLRTPLPPRARAAANALGVMAVMQVHTVNQSVLTDINVFPMMLNIC